MVRSSSDPERRQVMRVPTYTEAIRQLRIVNWYDVRGDIESNATLYARWGNSVCRQRVLRHAYSLCVSIALRQTMVTTIDWLELANVGVFGLDEALDRYRPDRGALFTSYARARIAGQMIDFARDTDAYSRESRKFFKQWERVRSVFFAEHGRLPTYEEMTRIVPDIVLRYRENFPRDHTSLNAAEFSRSHPAVRNSQADHIDRQDTISAVRSRLDRSTRRVLDVMVKHDVYRPDGSVCTAAIARRLGESVFRVGRRAKTVLHTFASCRECKHEA
jgi:DNA-directed RNA polymerase specialized sigma subunit